MFRLSLVLAAYLALGPALGPGTLGDFPTVDNPAGLPGLAGDLIVDPTWGVAVMLLLGLSLGSVVVRFRRSRGVERQQLTWLALAGGLAIGGLLFGLPLECLDNWLFKAFLSIAFAGFLLMPVAVAIAILRYRLYEIDRIVSRTLVYASLTVVLGAAYVGLVLAGQALFSSFAGGSNLAIAVSTLVVAALFLPVRARVQRFVDRRFYRRRYDAQRTLEGFGARLREQVDLDELGADLQASSRRRCSRRRRRWLRREGAAREHAHRMDGSPGRSLGSRSSCTLAARPRRASAGTSRHPATRTRTSVRSAFVLAFIAFPVVGAAIVGRRPRKRDRLAVPRSSVSASGPRTRPRVRRLRLFASPGSLPGGSLGRRGLTARWTRSPSSAIMLVSSCSSRTAPSSPAGGGRCSGSW